MPVDPPLQHPLAQEFASHSQTPTVVSQRPFAQDAQAAPAVPHCAPVWLAYGTHVLPLQHPFLQEVASHTHLPETHS